MNVHILKSIPENESSSTLRLTGRELVFKTLRIGFPTACITEWEHPGWTHAQWIKTLIYSYPSEPFWICDTDIIFYKPIEHFTSTLPLAGRFIPTFHEPHTDCISMARIHPSLAYINPGPFLDTIREWEATCDDLPSHLVPKADLIEPILIPPDVFYDTLAMYNGPREPFLEDILDSYTHLFAGSFWPLLDKTYPDIGHMARYLLDNDGQSLQGLWRSQEQFFYERRR